MVQDTSSNPSRPFTNAALGAVGRSLPHSLEAEEYLLSCCLLDGADVVSRCLEAQKPLGRFIYMSPRGKLLTQDMAQELAKEERLSILCGRYEGVDQRLLDAYGAEEISVGDYVLSGGEAAAMTLLDACIRLIPGTIGNAETHGEESFSGGLLEYPHYTRPQEWTSPDGTLRKVPDVLVSGHHAKVKDWRLKEAEKITQERRADLWAKYKK